MCTSASKPKITQINGTARPVAEAFNYSPLLTETKPLVAASGFVSVSRPTAKELPETQEMSAHILTDPRLALMRFQGGWGDASWMDGGGEWSQ